MPFQGINLTHSEFVPQYQGLPLEAMERVGDTLQDRHYQNIANASQLDILAKQQLADTRPDADRSYIQSQLGGIKEALAEMAKNGGENATGRVNALVTQFMGDEKLINIKKNAAALRQEEEMMSKLGSKGVLNSRAREEFLKRGSFDENGNFNPYYGSAQERLNYTAKADQIFEPLRANTYQTDLVGDVNSTLKAMQIEKVLPGVSGDLSSMYGKYKTQIIERLSKQRIDDFANNQGGWEDYKQSSEYQQQKNVLGLDDSEIKKEFLSRGYAKIYEKALKDWENNPMLGLLGKGSGEDTSGLRAEQMANMPLKYDSGLGDLEDFLPKDRESTDYQSNSSGQLGSGAPGRGMVTTKSTGYKGVLKNMPPARWQKFNETAKIAAEVFGAGELGDLSENSTPEEITKAQNLVKQYDEFLQNRVTYPVKDVTRYTREDQEGRDRAEDITKDVKRNITSRVIYDPESGKIIPVTKDGEMSKELQEVLGDGGLDNITVTGDLDPKNHIAKTAKNKALANAYVVQVTDPKDPSKLKEIFVSRPKYDNPMQVAYNDAVNEVYSTFNLAPGKEQTVSIAGRKIKGRELIGKQLESYLSRFPEEREEVMTYEMPIIAEIPGQGEFIFNGPDHLAQYLLGLNKQN
jgi:hypothetical protein